jgi:hypothetical protein
MSAIPQAADAPSHREAVLDALMDLGHELTRLVVDQAKAGLMPAATAAIAFERITRSIRRGVLVIHEVASPAKSIDRVAVRKRIIRTVEDTIEREADGPQAKILHREFLDRLDTLDRDADLSTRPVEDIIVEICHDLGIAAMPGMNMWKRRTPADLAQLQARAAKPPGVDRTTILSQGPGTASLAFTPQNRRTTGP